MVYYYQSKGERQAESKPEPLPEKQSKEAKARYTGKAKRQSGPNQRNPRDIGNRPAALSTTELATPTASPASLLSRQWVRTQSKGGYRNEKRTRGIITAGHAKPLACDRRNL